MKSGIFSAALAILACNSTDPNGEKRGPISMDKLWNAWESTGFHPDRGERYKPERGERLGGTIVERFYIDSIPDGDAASGTVNMLTNPSVDQYFCKEVTSDTCFQFDVISGILSDESDSVLSYNFLQTIDDDRHVWKLTDSALVLRVESVNGKEYSLKPSRRVLIDSSGGSKVVEWPKD